MTSRSDTWFPPKDIDTKQSVAFGANELAQYLLFYYYGILTLVANDLLPTTYLEVNIALILVFVGTIFIGIVIGELTSLISNITK